MSKTPPLTLNQAMTTFREQAMADPAAMDKLIRWATLPPASVAQEVSDLLGTTVESPAPHRVLITMEGGICQSVDAEAPDDLEVYLVDHDIDGSAAEALPLIFTDGKTDVAHFRKEAIGDLKEINGELDIHKTSKLEALYGAIRIGDGQSVAKELADPETFSLAMGLEKEGMGSNKARTAPVFLDMILNRSAGEPHTTEVARVLLEHGFGLDAGDDFQTAREALSTREDGLRDLADFVSSWEQEQTMLLEDPQLSAGPSINPSP